MRTQSSPPRDALKPPLRIYEPSVNTVVAHPGSQAQPITAQRCHSEYSGTRHCHSMLLSYWAVPALHFLPACWGLGTINYLLSLESSNTASSSASCCSLCLQTRINLCCLEKGGYQVLWLTPIMPCPPLSCADTLLPGNSSLSTPPQTQPSFFGEQASAFWRSSHL